jgi:hypothetical protein
LAELLKVRAQLEQREAELKQLERHLSEKEAKLETRESSEGQPTQVMGSPQRGPQAAKDTAAGTGQHTIVLTGNDSSAQATADRLLHSPSDDHQLQATLDLSGTATDERSRSASEPEELALDATLDFVPSADNADLPSSSEEEFFQTPKSGAPINTAEILANYPGGEALSTEADDYQTPSRPEASRALPKSETRQQPNTNEEAAGEDDDSIRQYMDQLMRRVRGESTQTSSLTTPAEPKQAIKQEPVAAPVDAAKNAEAATPPEVMSSDQYTPRSSAPEKTDNLAKMREVANTSARTAIDTASKAERQKAAAVNLLMATAAAGAGATLIGYSSAGMPVVRYVTAATALGAAAWWAYCAVTYALGMKALPSHSLLHYIKRASSFKKSADRAGKLSQQISSAEESVEQVVDAEDLV